VEVELDEKLCCQGRRVGRVDGLSDRRRVTVAVEVDSVSNLGPSPRSDARIRDPWRVLACMRGEAICKVYQIWMIGCNNVSKLMYRYKNSNPTPMPRPRASLSPLRAINGIEKLTSTRTGSRLL
jgi:hypothetical protein